MDKDTIMEFTIRWILTKDGDEIVSYRCNNCYALFPNRNNNLIPINCPCCGKQMIDINISEEGVLVI